jgi:hypothetical protein
VGYSIFYEIHDAEKMQEKWNEVIPYIQKSFKYLIPFAKSSDTNFPKANEKVIEVSDRSDMYQYLSFEKDDLVEGRDWIKTSLAPCTVAVETVLLIMNKVFGDDVFSIEGGDWEDIDIWYHAALICKKIGLEIDLHEVKYSEDWGEEELIQDCKLEAEIEKDIDFDDNLIYKDVTKRKP